MKNKKNNEWVIVLIVVIFVILLLISVLFANGMLSFSKENVNANNEINNDESVSSSYSFGDEVVLSQLSNIDFSSIGFPDETGNFSQWKVLKDEGEYITLYYVGSSLLISKSDKDETISTIKERQVVFSSNGIDFGDNGEIRIFNKDDLILFGCNFDTLECSNMPDWVSGWTSYTNDNYKFDLIGGKLNKINEDEVVLTFTNPIIKILKSNINN
jgi:hypothetical protein